MKNGFKLLVVLVASIGLMTATAPDAQAALWGCDWDGNLYNVSSADASLSLIGSTGLTYLGALEYSPSGTLYGFTAGFSGSGALYSIDPTNANATLIGSLGIGTSIEGGLAFSPGGTAYGVIDFSGGNADLFSVDLTSGAATVIGSMPFGDYNGLTWRSDGMLVGIEAFSNALVTIDPTTAATAAIAPLGFGAGTTSGMTTDFSTGISYFATGAEGGSNALYSFDVNTGANAFIGNFAAPSLASVGMSGLAATPGAPIPEPGTMMLLGTGLASVAALRRRFKR